MTYGMRKQIQQLDQREVCSGICLKCGDIMLWSGSEIMRGLQRFLGKGYYQKLAFPAPSMLTTRIVSVVALTAHIVLVFVIASDINTTHWRRVFKNARQGGARPGCGRVLLCLWISLDDWPVFHPVKLMSNVES